MDELSLSNDDFDDKEAKEEDTIDIPDGIEHIGEAVNTSDEIISNIEEFSRSGGISFQRQGNLRFLKPEWLHQGRYSQKLAQAVIVQRHRDSSYRGTYINIRFWKRSKQSSPFVNRQTVRFNLEETKKLLTYLRQAEISSGVEESILVPSAATEVLDNLDDTQKTTFSNILIDLAKSRRFAELISAGYLNSEAVDHLVAAVQLAKHKNDLSQLRDMVSGKTTKTSKKGHEVPLDEHYYQEWFEKHTWVFGTEYIRKIGLRNIDVSATVDFILETADGFFDVLELKTPNAQVLSEDKSHNTWYFSAEVSKVIAQAAKYLKFIERNATNIEADSILHENIGIKLVRPRVRVVIGRSNDWSEAKKESFRRLSSTLHNIELMTFDHVIQRAQQLINIYEQPSGIETVELKQKMAKDVLI